MGGGIVAGRTRKRTQITQTAVFRAGLLLFSVLVIFVVFRYLSIPRSFGQYGYFRGDNLDEWASLEANYAAGNEVCGNCHQYMFQGLSQGEHGRLNCQSCHGPMMKHVKNPVEWRPVVKGTAELCGFCHRELTGRSKEQIPTVKLGIHGGGVDCTRCHEPHQPWAKIGRM